jgi:hypothetical protein
VKDALSNEFKTTAHHILIPRGHPMMACPPWLKWIEQRFPKLNQGVIRNFFCVWLSLIPFDSAGDTTPSAQKYFKRHLAGFSPFWPEKTETVSNAVSDLISGCHLRHSQRRASAGLRCGRA